MKQSKQSLGNDRDAHVVEEICNYITCEPPRNFFLFAGAGSGKTRTLVEVLRRVTGLENHEVGELYAEKLRSRGQSIRVITYTKNAATIISQRLGENNLTAVSTIHTFCWELIKGFDEDIKDALLALNTERHAEARAYAQSKKNGENDTDRNKYAEIEEEASEIRSTQVFIYHPDRNTYGRGALSHPEVLNVAAWLLDQRPTLERILVDRHPIILIDESQDTMKGTLDVLFNLTKNRPKQFALGLIGDHRQRIYTDGHEDLPSYIPAEWARPTLQMNHRSQLRIVDLINTIWKSDIKGRTQPNIGIEQKSRIEKNQGTVRVFIGDSKISIGEKMRKEMESASVMAKETKSTAWNEDEQAYKTLALEHKLAARRGDFYHVFNAMEMIDKDAAKPKSNGVQTGPAMVRPILGPMYELSLCVMPDGSVDEFAVTGLLHNSGAMVNLSETISARNKRLVKIHASVIKFAAIVAKQDATVKDVLKVVIDGEFFDADPRLLAAYKNTSPIPTEPKNKSKELKEDKVKRGWHLLFNAPWQEIARYRTYLAGEAEIATHQVVKGSEFIHVMVVMDDEEAGGFLFSYDKLFGAKMLSDTDLKNSASGQETTIDRTLRLLYVTCSRAEESLALILWASNPQAAAVAIEKSKWFTTDEVIQI